MPLKAVVQDAQKEEQKLIRFQRVSKVLHLSSKMLLFLLHHTIQIKMRQAIFQRTLPLLVLPNPYKRWLICCILPFKSQSKLARLNNLCHIPKVNKQYRSIVSTFSINKMQQLELRICKVFLTVACIGVYFLMCYQLSKGLHLK